MANNFGGFGKKAEYNFDNPDQINKLLEDDKGSKSANDADTKECLPDDTKDTVVNDAANSTIDASISDKNVDDTVNDAVDEHESDDIKKHEKLVETDEQTSCENSETSSDQGSSKNDDNEALNKDAEASCENSDAQSDKNDEHSEIDAEAPTIAEDAHEAETKQTDGADIIDDNESETEADSETSTETESKTDVDSEVTKGTVDNTAKKLGVVDAEFKPAADTDKKAVSRKTVLIACIALLCVVFGAVYMMWSSTRAPEPSDTIVDNVDGTDNSVDFVLTEPDSVTGTVGEDGTGTSEDGDTSGSGDTSTPGSGDTITKPVAVDSRFFDNGKVVEDPTNYSGKYVASDVGDYVDIGYYVDESGILVNSSTKETKSETDLDCAYAANNGYLTVDNVWFGNDDIGKPGAKTLYCDGTTKISVAKFTNNSNKDGTLTLYVGSNSEIGSIRVYDIYVNSELCQYSRDVSYSNSKVDFVPVNWENVYYSGNNNLGAFTLSVVVVGADGSTLAKIDNVSIIDYIK